MFTRGYSKNYKMKITKDTVKFGSKQFVIVKFSFNIADDKKIIQEFKELGEHLAKKLNPVLARDSSKNRNYQKVLSNAIAGEISEFCWRYWITNTAKKLNVNINLHKTDIDEKKNQIDIVVEYDDGRKKTAEVRSSFPYAGLVKAITTNFDILGWYFNEIKINEIRKGYYLRALFPFNVNDFVSKLNGSFDVFLCGGASKKLLEESPYSKDKELIPYDEFIEENIKLTKYRVIEPIINGFDTDKITELIIKGVQE